MKKEKETVEVKPEAEKAKKPAVNVAEVIDDVKDAAEKAADFVGDVAKNAGEFAGEALKQARDALGDVKANIDEELSKRRLEKYKPVFTDTLGNDDFAYPKMINVVDFDKRMGIEECRGAIGFQEKIKDSDILGVYQNDALKFKGIHFYPDRKPSPSVYYVHPLDNDQYIEITEYFSLLKEQRITELEYIAQKLGAKYFEVRIIEEKTLKEISKAKMDAKAKVNKDKAEAKVESESSHKTFESIGIAATNTYPGKEPEEPELKLWANNESIKSLVKQRLSKDNPLQSKTFRLDYNTSSGIKEKEAAKIDGVLKVLKLSAAGSIQKEAQKESRRRFEYRIDF